jgi:hypothetical protein
VCVCVSVCWAVGRLYVCACVCQACGRSLWGIGDEPIRFRMIAYDRPFSCWPTVGRRILYARTRTHAYTQELERSEMRTLLQAQLVEVHHDLVCVCVCDA